MFKQLLVPLDGSRLAEAALPAAPYLAHILNASVKLVHIIEKNAPKEIHGDRHLTDNEEARTYLEDVAKHALATPMGEINARKANKSEIMARTGGSAVPAVKDDKVWILYRNMLYGPDSIVGAAFMAKLFHPEINLDPVGIYKEYLTLLDVKYPQDRTFIFPELTSE